MTSADDILAQLNAPAVLASANRRTGREPDKPGLPVPPPSHDPAMFRGIVGELALAADPTTEADPAVEEADRLAFCRYWLAARVTPATETPIPVPSNDWEDWSRIFRT